MAVQPIKVPASLAYVLNRAGDKSNVDFDYLLQTAMRESSLDPDAKASTSSAVGLFQFLDNTWLDVMKSDGARLGYQRYADAIVESPDGEYTIPDKRLREEVLSLRENPQVAADLAAAFTRRNGEYLKNRFGRMPSPGELYIAHFLGARGAAKLFEAGLQNPDQIAANLFPRQADANQAIFYANGKPRTIREVYKALVAQHGTEPGTAGQSRFAAQQLASGSRADQAAAPSGPLEMSFTSLFSTGQDGATGSPLQPETGTPVLSHGPAEAGFFVQLYSK